MSADASSAAEATVSLVLFDVGGARYGADLAQVRRVDRVEPLEVVEQGFGPTAQAVRRALVFVGVDGRERRVAIDQLLGVRAVPSSELRRMPAAAARASPFSIGAWLDGDQAVLLVDLPALPAAPETRTTPPGAP